MLGGGFTVPGTGLVDPHARAFGGELRAGANMGGLRVLTDHEIFRRELTIKGSFAQQFAFDRALSALRGGRVDPVGIITKRFSLDEYGDALAAVADSSVVKAVIVP